MSVLSKYKSALEKKRLLDGVCVCVCLKDPPDKTCWNAVTHLCLSAFEI